jgi:putative peptide zinc metalloprotease protein
MRDPIIASQVDVREAQLRELQERYDAARVKDRVQAEILSEQINHIQKSIELLEARKASLNVDSKESGRFVALQAENMPGRFVKQGELLGYVIGQKDVTVRTIVAQSDVDLVRQRTKRVLVRFASDLSTVYTGHIVREIPGAEQEVPSMALTTQGGGTIAIDPSSKSPKPQALFGLFQFDIALDTSLPNEFGGQRAYVLFDFGKEPIAWRFVRAFRQAFLSHFHV